MNSYGSESTAHAAATQVIVREAHIIYKRLSLWMKHKKAEHTAVLAGAAVIATIHVGDDLNLAIEAIVTVLACNGFGVIHDGESIWNKLRNKLCIPRKPKTLAFTGITGLMVTVLLQRNMVFYIE